MKLFYTLGLEFYVLAIKIAATWNVKARKWVSGRKNVWDSIENFNPADNVIWFHCASLGEFEQGRPVMEKIKSSEDCQIVVSFFSPSGYEIKKDYAGADLVVYLPKDSKKNAKRFFKAIQPKRVFFVKYEFWANYIIESKRLEIPIYSIAAIFRKKQIFFRFYGGFMRSVLKMFTGIYVQNKSSKVLLESINIESEVCGDTRYDRVYENAINVESYENIREFVGDKNVLICGSIWPEDLKVLKSKLCELNDWKIIIAPHEIRSNFIHEIIDEIKLPAIQYSVLSDQNMEANVLIIDNVGMLMNVYQYGTIAYVGGAFRTGLHNILEPAVFGLPVIFGPNHSKFPEAQQFIKADIGFSIEDEADFERVFDQLKDLDHSMHIKHYMNEMRGATDKIFASTQIDA